MNQGHVFILQHFHVTDQAGLRVMRIEDRLRHEVAASLPLGELEAGRQQIVLLRHLLCGSLHLEDVEQVVDVLLADCFVD